MSTTGKISIVTPCLNRAGFIRDAIESVLRQDYPEWEHIVVDGGSTDGTLEVLSGYPHLQIVSEPDDGLYHALNKGIRLARGEIIGFLNSDDRYEENIFSMIAEYFAADPSLDTICGEATVFEKTPEGTRKSLTEYVKPKVGESGSNIILGKPFINARFFRSRVFERIGLYDTRFHIAADRDLLLRAVLAGTKGKYLDRPVYHYCRHPGSLSVNPHGDQANRSRKEHLSIAEYYLQREVISSEVQRDLKLWHSRETSEMVLCELRSMRLRHAGYYMLRGWRHHICWPWVFISRVLPRIVRFGYSRLVSEGSVREGRWR